MKIHHRERSTVYTLRMLAAGLALCASGFAFSQVGFPPPPPKVSPAAGVIDMHVHPDPDVFGRSLTDVEMATIARRKGMRGIVLKNHVVTTADRAALAMQQVPGIDVWGGIVLNSSVGGVNPAAVEWMHRMSGGRGKMVWLPTFDSDKHVKTLVDKSKSGLLEPHEFQTWRLLHAAPQPYTRERFDDTYDWTVKWNMTVPGATYESIVDNRAWQ